MTDPLLALLLFLAGLGCIVAWGVCRVMTERRALRLRREADAIKAHVVRGGYLPARVPRVLAEGYLELRWLDKLGNALLAAGIAGMAAAHFFIL